VSEGIDRKSGETELQFFLSQYANVTDLRGRKTVVRNGYLPEREVLTGLGPIGVKAPKMRDRS
jgi:putative transposase